MARSAALREPHRAALFALALLIHVGLIALLVSDRHTRVESPERQTVLVFVQGPHSKRPPVEIAPPPPPRLPELSPPSDMAPQLIAPPQRDQAGAPPSIDWHRDAEEVARERAQAAAAGGEPSKEAPAKPKPEFGWSHSATRPVEPLDGGGFVVWFSDRCGVTIATLALPFCMFGKKPARGDLFEHMNDPPKPGDWKDE